VTSQGGIRSGALLYAKVDHVILQDSYFTEHVSNKLFNYI
jgi:hypothetical protein